MISHLYLSSQLDVGLEHRGKSLGTRTISYPYLSLSHRNLILVLLNCCEMSFVYYGRFILTGSRTKKFIVLTYGGQCT